MKLCLTVVIVFFLCSGFRMDDMDDDVQGKVTVDSKGRVSGVIKDDDARYSRRYVPVEGRKTRSNKIEVEDEDGKVYRFYLRKNRFSREPQRSESYETKNFK